MGQESIPEPTPTPEATDKGTQPKTPATPQSPPTKVVTGLPSWEAMTREQREAAGKFAFELLGGDD